MAGSGESGMPMLGPPPFHHPAIFITLKQSHRYGSNRTAGKRRRVDEANPLAVDRDERMVRDVKSPDVKMNGLHGLRALGGKL